MADSSRDLISLQTCWFGRTASLRGSILSLNQQQVHVHLWRSQKLTANPSSSSKIPSGSAKLTFQATRSASPWQQARICLLKKLLSSWRETRMVEIKQQSETAEWTVTRKQADADQAVKYSSGWTWGVYSDQEKMHIEWDHLMGDVFTERTNKMFQIQVQRKKRYRMKTKIDIFSSKKTIKNRHWGKKDGLSTNSYFKKENDMIS